MDKKTKLNKLKEKLKTAKLKQDDFHIFHFEKLIREVELNLR